MDFLANFFGKRKGAGEKAYQRLLEDALSLWDGLNALPALAEVLTATRQTLTPVKWREYATASFRKFTGDARTGANSARRVGERTERGELVCADLSDDELLVLFACVEKLLFAEQTAGLISASGDPGAILIAIHEGRETPFGEAVADISRFSELALAIRTRCVSGDREGYDAYLEREVRPQLPASIVARRAELRALHPR